MSYSKKLLILFLLADLLDCDSSGEVIEDVAAGGDLSGTYPDPRVDGLQSTPIADPDEHPASEDSVLQLKEGEWTPVSPEDLIDLDLGDASLLGTQAGGDLSGTYPDPRVTGLEGTPVENMDPDSIGDGDVLTWSEDAGTWHPAPPPHPEAPPEESVPSNAETDLTRIIATSWEHEDVYTQVQSLDLGLAVEHPFGVAVAFGENEIDLDGETMLNTDGRGAVQARTLSQETFRVFVEEEVSDLPLRQRARLVPRAIVPLTEVELEGRHIVGGTVDRDASLARGAAFLLPSPPVMERVYDRTPARSKERVRLDIEVRGSYLLDRQGRAVDVEFLRMDLPTGGRPQGGEAGVQGGDFESWLYFDANKPLIDLNSEDLTVEKLMKLPGVGETLAERILSYLGQRRLIGESMALVEVRGITEEMVQGWEGLIEPPVS